MIVVAKTLEIVERGHFKVGTRQRRRKFLADGVEDANTSLFLDAFSKQFLGSCCAFLRRRLVVGDAAWTAHFSSRQT